MDSSVHYLFLLDWRMETKWGRFWNFSESAGYWKFCSRWWITNWENCSNWKWRLWNILGCIWKSKRNPRTQIGLVLWRIEIIKCSMVLEYKSLRRVTNQLLFLGIFPNPNSLLLQGRPWGPGRTLSKAMKWSLYCQNHPQIIVTGLDCPSVDPWYKVGNI